MKRLFLEDAGLLESHGGFGLVVVWSRNVLGWG